MAYIENERSITVVPDMESIFRVSEFLDNCLEELAVPTRVGYSLKVISDEIYSNIVYYSGAKTARILVINDADKITMFFEDDGKPYNPLETEEPDISAGIEERKIGGLGLFMVKKLAESTQYEYAAGKNQLTTVISKTVKKRKLSLEDFE